MFCGHSQVFEDFEDKLYKVMEKEISDDMVEFLLGGYGNFDEIALQSCIKYKRTHKNVKLSFITPYFDNLYLNNRKEKLKQYDEIIYPF